MIRTALIITSLCGAGLEREAYILKDLLESHGVAVQIIHYTDMSAEIRRADVMFSLEVVMPRSLGLAERAFLYPNSEWWHPANDVYLPRFDKILCKTQDCFEIWSRKVGMDHCAYTGFEARDLYDHSIVREEKFLHVAGRSEYKGTAAVLECWRTYEGLPPLVVVSSNPKFKTVHIPTMKLMGSPITIFDRVAGSQLQDLMNSSRYHILPSEYEGFGHALHEGLGCDAHIITTGCPSTHVPGTSPVFVEACRMEAKGLTALCKVNADGVYAAVRMFLDHKWNEITTSPRHFFLRDREFFRHTLWNEINQ